MSDVGNYRYSGKNMEFKNISAIIRFHRKQAGLTQEELATLAGIGKTCVFDIENGKSSIRFSNLTKVFDALNIQLKLDSPMMEHFNENS